MLDAVAYFALTSGIYTSPLIIALWLFRRRVSRVTAALSLGSGFGIAMAFSLWRIEWFDVWRHGVPSASYLAMNYGPLIVIAATVGALLGGALSRSNTTPA